MKQHYDLFNQRAARARRKATTSWIRVILAPALAVVWLLGALVWLNEASPAQGAQVTVSPSSAEVVDANTATEEVRIARGDAIDRREERSRVPANQADNTAGTIEYAAPPADLAPQAALLGNSVSWTAVTSPTALGVFWDVAVGDVNHDGHLDVVATLFGDYGVRAWLGDGAGTWTASSTGLPTTGAYRGVVLGDLNNDGALDIVAAGQGSGIGVWQGDGTGGWSADTGPLNSDNCSDVALGDINDDGTLDLVATRLDDGGIKAWLSGGLGLWNWYSASTGLPTSGTYHGLAFGDVANSGRLDLAASPDSGGLVVYRSTGTGDWVLQADGLPTSGSYRGLTFADLDGDQDLELVTASASAGVQVWDRDEAGTWQEVDNGLPGAGVFRNVAVADVNNDGKLDIGASMAGGGMRVWVGNGRFAFFPASSGLPLTASGYAGLAFGDLDDDGQADLFAANTDGAGVHIWRNSRTPMSWLGWSAGTEPGQAGSWNDVALTPDGLVAVGTASSCVWIWSGDGLTWTVEADLPCTNDGLLSIAVGDLNHDGYWDLVASTEALGLRAWVRGASWSSFDTGLPVTGTYRSLALGDVNRDGQLDIAAAGDGLGVRVWLGDGSGNWTSTPGDLPTAGTWWDVALGDLDNDGWPELLATSQDNLGIQIYWWYSILPGRWNNVGPPWVGNYYGLDLGDINDDGKLDIAAARAGSGGVEMYFGDGAFGVITATSPYTTPVAMYARDVALGDVNHDGKLDLAAVGVDEVLHLGRLSFWLGDGGTTWTEAHPPNAEADSATVILGQLNGDGLLDLVAVKATGDIWPWLAGDFTPPGGWFPYTPDDWVNDTQSPTCTTAVKDMLSGLDVSSAYYAYSTDGGATWSGWQGTACSGTDGITTTQQITATAVPFNQDSGQTNQNRIRYLIRDTAGNWGLSPDRYVLIDTQAPENPTAIESTSHTVDEWSTDNTVRVQWSGAADASSGVDGYSIAWTHSSSSLPDPTLTTHNTFITSDPLGDADDWYFHVRTVDEAGNWAGDARHLGPFKIDTTPPGNPSTVTSSSHTVGEWSADNTIDVQWSGATDASSGVYGYSITWTHSASSTPDQIVDTTGTSATSSPLADGDDWYFHVWTVDVAGNWAADARHVGPFKIDTTPPQNPTPFSIIHAEGEWSNNPDITMYWPGASDAGSGVAGYNFAMDNDPYSDLPPVVPSLAISFTFPDRSDDYWYFHLQTADNTGNWSEIVHTGPYKIDTQPPGVPTFDYSNPPVDTWSNDNTVYVDWYRSDTFGGSPIQGYSIAWSQRPDNVPDTIVDERLSETTSDPLPYNGEWYVHVKAADEAGNWSDTAHLGPFKIDLSGPSLPSTLDSPTHTPGEESVLDTVTVEWSVASDFGGSGLAGYSYVWSEDQWAFVDNIVDTADTSHTSAPLSEGDWWFILNTVDHAGNGAAGYEKIGPFRIRPVVLDVSIDPGIQHPAPGQRVDYLLIVGNSGVSTAEDVELEVAISPNLDYKGCTAGGGACGFWGGVARWSLGELVPGEEIHLMLYLQVDPSAIQDDALEANATLRATDTAEATASATTYVQTPECPNISTRIFDAAPDETVYTLIPPPGRTASGTAVQVQVRLTTPDFDASRYISVTVEVPGDVLGSPRAVTRRRWSGGDEVDAEWDDLGGGRYQTTVDLEFYPQHGDYRQQVLFTFRVTEDIDPRTLRFGVEVQHFGRTCYDDGTATRLVEAVDAVVITNRHHLYEYYDEQEVNGLLRQVFEEVNGEGDKPTGAVYYLDLYDDDILDWDNTAIDWTNSSTVNEVAHTVVNRLISGWYRDAAWSAEVYPADVSLPPAYLLIVGDDNVVPYHREQDPAGSERDHPDGPNDVLRDAQSHNYFFDDAYYSVPTWNFADAPDWRHGDSRWAVGRIVGATAGDMRDLLTNGSQGPSARSGDVIAASYDGNDLTGEYSALAQIRSWGFNVRNDSESPQTVESDNWYTNTLYSLMQADFVGLYYMGHGHPQGIGAPRGGDDNNAILSWELPDWAGSFHGDRPFFVIQSCRVGQSYTPYDWSYSFIYSLVHNGISAAIAAGGISWFMDGYGWDDYGEEFAQLVIMELFDAGDPAPFGEALRSARRRYDEGLIWEDGDEKTVREFILFGLPWASVPRAVGSGAQITAARFDHTGPLLAQSTLLSPQQETTSALTDTLTVTLTATLDASDYSVDTATLPGYDLLQVSGFRPLNVLHRPVLPVRHLTFTLPMQAQLLDASVSVTDAVVLTDLNIPMQVPIVPSPEFATTVFTDTADWVGTWPTQTLAVRLRPQDYHQMGHIWVVPATYDPVADQATLYQQIALTVTYQITQPLAMPRFIVRPVNAPDEPIPARAVVANVDAITRTVWPVLSVFEQNGTRVGLKVGDLLTVPPGGTAVTQIDWTRPLTEGRYIAVLSMMREGETWTQRARRFVVRGIEISQFDGPETAGVGETVVYSLTLSNHQAISITAKVSLLVQNLADGGSLQLGSRAVALEAGLERTLRLPLHVRPEWSEVLVQAQVEVDDRTYHSQPLLLRIDHCAGLHDLNGDRRVDLADIQFVASRWRSPSPGQADRNGDGKVTILDIMMVVAQWGQEC